MAPKSRYFKNDPELENIIEDLVHFYIEAGSLKRLSEFLSELTGETIRPNRLAPILGSDFNRSVNSSTLEKIRSALNLAQKSNKHFELSIKEKLADAYSLTANSSLSMLGN